MAGGDRSSLQNPQRPQRIVGEFEVKLPLQRLLHLPSDLEQFQQLGLIQALGPVQVGDLAFEGEPPGGRPGFARNHRLAQSGGGLDTKAGVQADRVAGKDHASRLGIDHALHDDRTGQRTLDASHGLDELFFFLDSQHGFKLACKTLVERVLQQRGRAHCDPQGFELTPGLKQFLIATLGKSAKALRDANAGGDEPSQSLGLASRSGIGQGQG